MPNSTDPAYTALQPVKPGKRNVITDVPGILVGAAHDPSQRTGVSVILPKGTGFQAVVECRGGAPGTRETDALAAGTLVDHVHAIVLSGGSAYGLDAASGAQSWLLKQGRGYAIHGACVPIVPAAILFDLANGGSKPWLTPNAQDMAEAQQSSPPYRVLAERACDSAGIDVTLGNAGAGYGCVAGPYKGGLGGASAIDPETGLTLGAHIAVNSFGSPATPDGAALWAAPFELNGEFGGADLPHQKTQGGWTTKQGAFPGGNTTIGVVATNASLSRDQLERLAVMAADGFARAIRPVHTPYDGDLLFALSTGSGALTPDTHEIESEIDLEIDAARLTVLGTLAADTVARAIGRAMIEAQTLDPYPAFRERA